MRTVLRPAAWLVTSALVGVFASAASATTLVATSANLASVFAAASGADTIVLSGRFGTTTLSGRSFDTPLQIDARHAQFGGMLVIRDMHGLAITGGRYGSPVGTWQNAGTIRVEDSDGISFTKPHLYGDGLGAARGLTLARTSNFTVDGGTFSGFRLALGGNAMTNGVFSNNRITRATSDGINIVDSHFITASGNSCSGGTPSAGAHPDCIQLWSLAGNPVQSDIKLLNNTATGYTQGFTSFDPDRGGGLRISIIGNRVDSSMPQGIACYACVDSIITDNVLTTQPGARFRTSLNIVGGDNNTVANNSVGALNAAAIIGGSTPAARFAAPADSSGLDIFDQLEASEGEWSSAALAAVPEPGVWAQLLAGFAMLGGFLRRRRASPQFGVQEAG